MHYQGRMDFNVSSHDISGVASHSEHPTGAGSGAQMFELHNGCILPDAITMSFSQNMQLLTLSPFWPPYSSAL